MLGDQPLIAFVPVSDLAVARRFYVDVLGLRVTEESPYALAVDAGGTALRLTLVDDLRPQPFTVAGWQVTDVPSMVEALAAKGVPLIRYDGMDQDQTGVWRAPGGALVAWFADPDGNTLSLTQAEEHGVA